jgi:O-antigen ligase
LLIFFSVLTVLALGTFGAVQPHSYLFVQILWSGALAALVIGEALRTHRLSFGTLSYVAVSAVALFLDYRLAFSLLSIGWGWIATKKQPLMVLSFLKFLIVIGVIEALLGLFQYFVEPGWIFGYHNRFFNSTGTLINRNHFAGLLEMIVPATVALALAAIMRGRDFARAYFFIFLGACIAIAIVFSTSRMGFLSCLLTLLFMGAALRLKATHKGTAALTLVIIGLVGAGALWIGVDILVQRFGELNQDELLQGRPAIYADTLKMIAANPLGVGFGAYRDMFRRYQSLRPDLLIDHAHNDYLEMISEWGIFPAIVFWTLIFVVFGRAFRSFLRTQSVERTTILLASMGAIFSILVHSLTDFNLQIPSNAMLFFMFVGIAAQASSSEPFPVAEKS